MFTVGHVRTPVAVLEDHRAARCRIHPKFPERWPRHRPATTLGLGQDGQAAVEGDGEQLLLGLQAAAVGALPEVRPEAPVLHCYLHAVGRIHPDHPRKAEELHGILEGDPLQGHRLEERGRPRAGRLVGVGLPIQLVQKRICVGEAPGRLEQHVQVGQSGVGALTVANLGQESRRQQRSTKHLVGRDVRPDRQVVGQLHEGPHAGQRPSGDPELVGPAKGVQRRRPVLHRDGQTFDGPLADSPLGDIQHLLRCRPVESPGRQAEVRQRHLDLPAVPRDQHEPTLGGPGLRTVGEPAQRHVGPEPTRAGYDHQAGLRVGPQLPIGRRVQVPEGPGDRQLVERHVIRDRGGVLPHLYVRSELSETGHHELTVVRDTELYRADPAGVDVAQPGRDLGMQADVVLGPEVEGFEPRHALRSAVGYLVEVLLHGGGEVVVHESGEVELEQGGHGEGTERRHERRALLEDVVALDGLHDRGVRRWPTHPELLHPLDQRGLGEAGRRLGRVAVR